MKLLITVLAALPLMVFGGDFVENNVEFAERQTSLMLDKTGAPTGQNFPRTANTDGSLRTTNGYDWTPGFFPGSLWYLYELTGSEKWRTAARTWTAPMEPVKKYTGNHDLGFMMYCSYGNAERLAPEAGDRAVLIESANSLCTRFVEGARTIKSWDSRGAWNGSEWKHAVIIDNMMNLELLFYASKITGNPKYRDIAVSHADATLKNHFREDFSTYHVVDYDPVTGEVRGRATAQGLSDNSTWARGQAWAIYGFTMCYRETGDRRYLDAAVRAADWWLARVPKDMVPLWDFNTGQEGYEPAGDSYAVKFRGEKLRDASAAAIVCSALFELDKYKGGYFKAAEKTLRSLASPAYRAAVGANADFLLMHSVGSIPHHTEIDVPLVYADYYFLEALVRYRGATKNWEQFLGRHDLLWDDIKADYYAGSIMGNGMLGCNIYEHTDGRSLKFHVGRVDVTEGRSSELADYNCLYDGARLPIGYFLMKPSGAGEENMRLSLWNAETTGRFGGVGFRSYVHAVRNVIVVETEGDFEWEWVPQRAVSPRMVYGRKDYPQRYADEPNPAVKQRKQGEYNLSIQNLVGGKTYVVAWRRDGGRILSTIAHETTGQQAVEKAISTIEQALKADLEKSHRDWWHAYYPASHATFPDPRIEGFYWMQQYKLACLTRPDKMIIDLQGPWAVDDTIWPAVWNNLNLQLTYSPLFTANRAEFSEPLWRALDENMANLIENSGYSDAAALGRSSSYDLNRKLDAAGDPMLYEAGNLTWLLYYYYEYCRYTGNDWDKFWPLLRRAVAYYEHIRERRDDGLYHLPRTASPEYAPARDCNYDLAVLRWGLETLLKHEEEPALRDFLDNLAPYPVDPERGYMIGEGVNLTSSHRHYSHLLMVYPLHTVSATDPLSQKSIAHWQSMPAALQGYSFTGSSSMYSLMGDGERAVAQLRKLLDRFIQPNTLYKETGPVIETPLAAAASIQELYLQSWGGVIRVFPAVPKSWVNASFSDFRAEGAFLVSAVRRGGRTVSITIKSEKGGRCTVESDMGRTELSLHKGETRNLSFRTFR